MNDLEMRDNYLFLFKHDAQTRCRLAVCFTVCLAMRLKQ